MSLVVEDKRAGAEIVHGAQECYQQSIDLLEELGFPKGVLPLQDLVECGRVRETGFVWMKQKAPYEHFFVGTNTRVSYSTEVTAYVEKGKMKKMTGIKSKQMFLWVPVSEMIMEEPACKKITFNTPMGIGKTFPITAFMTEEEKKKYLEEHGSLSDIAMGLKEEFEEHAEKARILLESTTNENKLILYGLYKQATIGNVNTDRPGMFSMKERARWDAWKAVEGKSKDEAMGDYITMVKQLLEEAEVSA